jgi:predicted phage terminase large subunit-like protein
MTILQTYKRLSEQQRKRFLASLSPEEVESFMIQLEDLAKLPWHEIARPEQRMPEGDWLTWAFIAGRGAGKTRSAAEAICDIAEKPNLRIALVGRIPADVRDVMVEGESGIIACARRRGIQLEYIPSKGRLVFPNGSTCYTYSSEVPAKLRGPQHHAAWADELSSWTDATKGDIVDTAWNNLLLGLRLGEQPKVIVTTTPKPNRLTKTIMGRATTVITKGSTYDNLKNLAPSFKDTVLAAYEGTRIGRQELMGEMLEDVEGALWTNTMMEECLTDDVPDMQRIIVAIDPSGGDGDGNDEQGIVVAGQGVDGLYYVLDDRSCKLSPNGWASRAIQAYREYEADKIVAEKNFGGDMVEAIVRAVDKDVPFKMVTASRGKMQRAEPIAALYEQGKVRHVKGLEVLESQMTSWTPTDGTSPDRMDAMVWALTELSTGNKKTVPDVSVMTLGQGNNWKL